VRVTCASRPSCVRCKHWGAPFWNGFWQGSWIQLQAGRTFRSSRCIVALKPFVLTDHGNEGTNRGGEPKLPEGRIIADMWQVTVKYRPICSHRSFQRKRSKIKQIGRYLSVYLVQSVHAPHSREVNAARAS